MAVDVLHAYKLISKVSTFIYCRFTRNSRSEKASEGNQNAHAFRLALFPLPQYDKGNTIHTLIFLECNNPHIFLFRFLVGVHSPCMNPFDKAGGEFAHAFSPESGTVHFDDDETFTDGVSSGTNLFSVALHEIGHLLGLRHSSKTSAIMHEIYKAYDPNMKLTDDDKHGINYLYGG